MASPVDTSVKHALSSMPGAPVINGQAGSRLAAIRAFAVTGFGVKTVDAGGTISAGKCRLPFSTGASAAVVNSVILVAGATPGALNGEQKVTAVGNAWVEFATALPDGAVTGSVTFKMAPLGWEEVAGFSKPNVAVFRPADLRSSRPYLRIDDSNATYAIVQMYESMSDVDNGINGTPARYWYCRSSASANAVSWTLAGDSRGMFFGVAPNSANSGDFSYGQAVWYVGDIVSDKKPDIYPALLVGNATSSASQDGVLFFGSVSNSYIMRLAAGIGIAGTTTVAAMVSGGNVVSGADSSWGPFPSRAAQALFVVPLLVGDGGTLASTGRRGQLPGARYCPQSGVLSYYGSAPAQIPGTDELLDKTLLTVPVGSSLSSAANGLGFIDVTGPWRLP